MQAPTAISPTRSTKKSFTKDIEPNCGTMTSDITHHVNHHVKPWYNKKTQISSPGAAVSEQMTLNTTKVNRGVTTVSPDSQTTTNSTSTSHKIKVIKNSEVSRLNENCIYLREARLFKCQNWKVSTIISDLSCARNLSFKLSYTVREAMLDKDKPVHLEWLKIATDIVPPFT